MSTLSTTIERRRLFWVGPLTVIAALVAVLLVRTLFVTLVSSVETMMQFGLGPQIVFTTVLVTGAVLVFALVTRYSKEPLRFYQRLALGALVLSFVPDALLVTAGMPGATWPNVILLMILHVVAWAVTVGLLTRLTVVTNA